MEIGCVTEYFHYQIIKFKIDLIVWKSSQKAIFGL